MVLRTVVLLGGDNEEREVSLKSGRAVSEALRSLQREDHEIVEFDWHPRRIRELLDANFDHAFIALHGGAGEDGRLRALLEMAGIPSTGCSTLASSIAMNKQLSKTIVASQTEVNVIKGKSMSVCEAIARLSHNAVDTRERWRDILEQVGLPMVVKPSGSGSSVGVSLVFEESALDDAVRDATFNVDDLVMFEHYIKGYELTVAVLDDRALGVCRIIPKTDFYDYEAKYVRDDTEYCVPSGLGDAFDASLCRQAEIVTRSLSCTGGCVRVDFLADMQMRPYFLEINTVPGMTRKSLVPKIAQHAGMTFATFCAEVLALATSKRRKN